MFHLFYGQENLERKNTSLWPLSVIRVFGFIQSVVSQHKSLDFIPIHGSPTDPPTKPNPPDQTLSVVLLHPFDQSSAIHETFTIDSKPTTVTEYVIENETDDTRPVTRSGMSPLCVRDDNVPSV